MSDLTATVEPEGKDLLVRATQQLEAANNMLAELHTELAKTSEDAKFGKAIRKSNEWWDIGQVAQKLKIEIRPGKNIGRNQLYNFLMNTGMILYPKDRTSGKHYYRPKQIHEDCNRLKLSSKATQQENHQGEQIFDHRLLIGTEKGVPYIMKKLLDAQDDGVLDDLCSSWRDAQGWG